MYSSVYSSVVLLTEIMELMTSEELSQWRTKERKKRKAVAQRLNRMQKKNTLERVKEQLPILEQMGEELSKMEDAGLLLGFSNGGTTAKIGDGKAIADGLLVGMGEGSVEVESVEKAAAMNASGQKPITPDQCEISIGKKGSPVKKNTTENAAHNRGGEQSKKVSSDANSVEPYTAIVASSTISHASKDMTSESKPDAPKMAADPISILAAAALETQPVSVPSVPTVSMRPHDCATPQQLLEQAKQDPSFMPCNKKIKTSKGYLIPYYPS